MSDFQKSSYATVDEIVRSYLIDIGETSEHLYLRCLNMALEGVQDWNMDSAQEIKTVKLTMDDIKQVSVPLDYIDYTKLGIRCGDVIKNFSIRDNIPLSHDVNNCNVPLSFDSCDCEPNSFPNPNSNYISGYGGYYYYNYVNDYGEHLGGLFGYGGGYNSLGYARFDKENGVFQFDSSVNNTEVYLEYISTGFNPTGHTLVNQYAKKLIKEYIHMRRLKFSKDGSYRQAKEDYHQELTNARLRVMSFDIQFIMESSRRSASLSPKV